MNAGFTADDPFRNGRAEDKAAESHAGNLSRTWGEDTVSSGTPLFHSYGLDWMGYSLWNGRGPCCPTENSKNSRSVPGRRVLLLRPVQHTGLYGLSAVCKKGRLVPLAQERPFLIFYLGVLQTKVNSKNKKSPEKFARPKKSITKQAGERRIASRDGIGS